ncbi:MAG: TIM barrel protein, partial [Clostridia bacterium]|nr:TIM barrel protein [Clostridia bacterium]
MLIGAHVSVSKGFPAAVDMACRLSLDTFQFFTRNPRGGRVRALTDKEVREFRQKIVETGIQPVVGHLPYTVNLGAEEKRLSDFARQVVAEDLGRCDLLGAEFLVTHPGRHGGDLRAGLERVVRLLAQALEGREYRAILLLETMAGQGNEIGGDFSELAFILKA